MSADLIAFLTARLDEDEAAAKAVADYPAPWRASCYNHGTEWAVTDASYDFAAAEVGEEAAFHIALHDPARVLREVEAKRVIVNLAAKVREWTDGSAGATAGYAAVVVGDTLRVLAAVYSDHPDYDQSWKP